MIHRSIKLQKYLSFYFGLPLILDNSQKSIYQQLYEQRLP